jgi:hypothetical protein
MNDNTDKNALIQLAMFQGIIAQLKLSAAARAASQVVRLTGMKAGKVTLFAEMPTDENPQAEMEEIAKAVGSHYKVDIELLAVSREQEVDSDDTEREEECDCPACRLYASIVRDVTPKGLTIDEVLNGLVGLMAKRSKS